MCLATMSRARSSSVASRTKTGTVKVSRAECLGAIRDSFYSGLFECELDDGRVPLWTIVDPQIGTVWLSRHGPSLAPFSTNRTAGAAGASRPSFAVFFGPPFADIHQKLQLPVVLGLGDWLRLERQRFFGSRIIEVPGHKVDVKMRHHVAEQLVVHVTRRKHALDHLRGGVNVAPVPGGFCRSQTRKVCDVAVAEDDDHMAASDGVSAQGVRRQHLPHKTAYRNTGRLLQNQHSTTPRFRASQSSGHVRVIGFSFAECQQPSS